MKLDTLLFYATYFLVVGNYVLWAVFTVAFWNAYEGAPILIFSYLAQIVFSHFGGIPKLNLDYQERIESMPGSNKCKGAYTLLL
jgi:hypothetical protein